MTENEANEILLAGDWAVRQSLDEANDPRGITHLLRAIHFIESHPEGLPSGNQRMVYAEWRMSCARVEEAKGLPEGSIRNAVRELLAIGKETRCEHYGPRRAEVRRRQIEAEKEGR